jgi:hypothetical protein
MTVLILGSDVRSKFYLELAEVSLYFYSNFFGKHLTSPIFFRMFECTVMSTYSILDGDSDGRPMFKQILIDELQIQKKKI